MKTKEEQRAEAVEGLVKMANDAAEQVARATGAPYAVVLLTGGRPFDRRVLGPKARDRARDAQEWPVETFEGGKNVIERDLRDEDRKKRDTYELGAELTHAIVKAWIEKEGAPEFAFPPREIALVADLRAVGQQLARNDSARRLVDQLNEHVVSVTGQLPTAMMLRVILEDLGVAMEWVPLSELGLKVPTS